MAFLVTFTTAHFDVSEETPNPINPIAGEGVPLWLNDKLVAHVFEATAPDSEDWGSYMDVTGNCAHYLVGASGDGGGSDIAVDWMIQIHLHRSIKERLLGCDKPSPDDPLFMLISELVHGEVGFTDVEVDANG